MDELEAAGEMLGECQGDWAEAAARLAIDVDELERRVDALIEHWDDRDDLPEQQILPPPPDSADNRISKYSKVRLDRSVGHAESSLVAS